jgi:hypothetical protein
VPGGADVVDWIRFTLRLPAELHAKLKVLAEREQRSLHGQILYILQQAVNG